MYSLRSGLSVDTVYRYAYFHLLQQDPTSCFSCVASRLQTLRLLADCGVLNVNRSDILNSKFVK